MAKYAVRWVNGWVLFALLATSLPGQVTTAVDGSTPPVLAVGSPVGSYKLSDFDTVNLFGGVLSFNLPIVPSSGGPAVPLTVGINQRWVIQYYASVFRYTVQDISFVDPLQRNSSYTPGQLTTRTVGKFFQKGCNDGTDFLYNEVVTRISFRDGDGTEHDFVDALSGGAPNFYYPWTSELPGKTIVNCIASSQSRGRVWVTNDGSGWTYISNDPVKEWANPANETAPLVAQGGLSGYLYKKDGTRLTITLGLVTEVRDRNGRYTKYVYGTNTVDYKDHDRPILVTDSMGREVRITYGLDDPEGGSYDRLSYKGTAEADRTVEVHYCDLLNTNVSKKCAFYDETPTPMTMGGDGGLFSIADRFPPLGSSVTHNNPKIVSYIKLPDGRRYQFRYNSYGELAKVILPTGGRLEYKHGPGVERPEADEGANSVVSGTEPGSAEVYRRVRDRWTYSDDGSLATHVRYKVAHLTSGCPYGYNKCTVVTEEHLDGVDSGRVLAATRHTFAGLAHDPESFYADAFFLDYKNGKEVETSVLDVSSASSATTAEAYASMAALKTIVNYWEQRPCAALEACPESIDPYVRWRDPRDPRIRQTTTVLSGVSGPSTVMYGYDRFNNKTVETATDYDNTTLYRRQSQYVTVSSEGERVDYARVDLTSANADSVIGDSSSISHLRNLPEWRKECASESCSGTDLLAKTEYKYDQSPLQASSGITQIEAISSGARGNLTSEVGWLNSQGSKTVSVSRTYYDFGAPYEVTDGRSNKTTYTWGCNGNTIHEVTNALGHKTTVVSDCNTGAPTSITDPNGVEEIRTYDDSLDRVTSSTTGQYAKTTFVYDDAARTITTKRSRNSTKDSDIVTTLKYDGLGRAIETSRTEPDGDGTVATQVRTKYDLMGRSWKVSQPFRSGANTTIAWTETLYDALGRTTSVKTPDTAVTSTTYAGNIATVVDPAQVKKEMETDALGQLKRVKEYRSASPAACDSETSQDCYNTRYTYDSRGNLLTVTQGTQSRSFTYDMFGRLHTATNPENASNRSTAPTAADLTTTYEYDANGNLTDKIDSRGTVSMTYDALNRIKTKTYTGSIWTTTPSVSYTYDDAINIDGVVSENKPLGRLVQVSNATSQTIYRYDGLGRPLASEQTTDGLTKKALFYDYVPAGMSSMTYPSGRVVKWTYDIAGRVESVKDGAGAPPFASSVTYDITGGLSKLTLGNSLEENWRYSGLRGQARSVMLGTTANPSSLGRWDFSYCAGAEYSTECAANNGNVMSQTLSPLGVTQSYTYDGMNRLKSFTEPTKDPAQTSNKGPAQTYVYDRFGNRALLSGSTLADWPGAALVTSDDPALVEAQFPNNQWTGSQVEHGFVTKLKVAATGTSTNYPVLSYDGEGRVATAVTGPSASATYGYDGAGRRVKRTTGGQTTYSIYDAAGRLAAEYGGTTAVGGRQYLTADALGSTRAVTDASGAIVARHDYMPFGEEIDAAANNRGVLYAGTDNPKQKFTGKERDTETGLDYFGARYFSAAQGRFTSPDPTFLGLNRLVNPLRWNLYTYALNNPFRYVDPDGRDAMYVVFKDYKASIWGIRAYKTGHAAMVVVDQSGHTTYREYGRYDTNHGETRSQNVPNLQMDANGHPTDASMKALIKKMSQQNQNGPVDVIYYDTTDDVDALLLKELARRVAENRDPSRPPYTLEHHNCGTLFCETMKVAGQKKIPEPAWKAWPVDIFQMLLAKSEWLVHYSYSSEQDKLTKKEKVTSTITYIP